MPSPSENSVDLPLITFGGLVTQYDGQTLPAGASPYNQDVSFSGVDPSGNPIVGGVTTRPGTGSGYFPLPFPSNPTINYIKTFQDAASVYHLLSADSLGVVRDESPCPTPAVNPEVIGQIVANAIMQSDTLINREWMAVSDLFPLSSGQHSGFGLDIPRQWDGNHFDRVSQEGPGAGPTASDSSPSQPISSITPWGLVAITSIESDSANPNLIDVTLSAPIPNQNGNQLTSVGDTVTISGTTSYNGTAVITSILSPTEFQYYLASPPLTTETGNVDFAIYAVRHIKSLTDPIVIFPGQFYGYTATISGATDPAYDLNTYKLRYSVQSTTVDTDYYLYSPTLFGEASTSGGVLTIDGDIGAGLHGVAVSFITEEQYITKPSPPVYFNASGSKMVQLSNIPTGPSNVIGRIVMFTGVITPPALSGDFYYFDGTVPLAGGQSFPSMVINDNTTTSVSFDFSDAVLEAATLSTNLYNLLELGECSNVTAYSNRLFWCGERNKITNFINLSFDGGFNGNYPLGWTVNPASGGGGSSSPTPYWGGAYRITGTASPSDIGYISQTAYQDYLGVTVLNINTAYSMRVRLKATQLTTGTVAFQVHSPSLGNLGTFTVNVNAMAVAQYTEFIGSLMASRATIPSDVQFSIFMSAPAPIGVGVDIDCIEVFPTNQPFLSSQVRGSYALDPESYDQETGFLDIEDNSIPVRATFNLLDGKLYILKEQGMYSTQDDGQNEPNLWAVPTVSATVGTGSTRGVGVGETWAVIAHKSGAYIFWGSEPVKISQEIQPTWDQINWNYDHTIYVTVDTISKRIHIGAPLGAATSPNVEFVCDYSQLANSEGQTSAQDIAAHPQAYYSVYNPTRVVAPGKARKWTLWNITMSSCALTINSDGSYHLLRGNGVGNGKVYEMLPTNLSDDGAAINGAYQTSFFPQVEDEQALQLGSGRKLYKYMRQSSVGVGTLAWIIYGYMNQRAMTLHPDTLQNPPYWGDQEKNINWVGERASLLFSTNAVGSWFKLTKLSLTLQRELFTPVRGTN